MLWASRLWLRLRTFLHRNRVAQELDDEIQFHLDQQIAENIAAGMSREEAYHAALRGFGNRTLLKEQTQDAWGWTWLDQFPRDVRHATRTLRRTPAFAAAAILVIALGIGTTTALFTVVRSVLLKPLPFKDPERLLRLYEHSSDDKFPYNDSAAGVFAEWRKQNHGFSDLALLDGRVGAFLSGAGGQLPEKVASGYCSWNLFPMLGVEPVLGRGFTAADDQPSANATVVLTWGLWKRRFAGDPAILGKIIHLNSQPYTVIGVMPRWFTYPDQSVQLWTPIYHELPVEEMQALDSHDFETIGRLKSEVSETQATAELSLIVRRLHDQHLDNPFVSKAANSRPLLEDMVGDLKEPLYVLLAATGFLLLIGCLNVASLLVARAVARRRELAIRTALGGSRWRLVCGHLSESFLLSGAGGALGLLLAYTVIRWFVSIRQDISRVETIHLDGLALAFAVALIVLCAFFAGMTSSLSINGGQILSSLQESSRTQSAGRAPVNLRKLLLSLEVGLTVVLLIGAGLLLKSYKRLRSSDLGCTTNNVLTMQLSLPDTRYSQQAQRLNFFQAVLERVRSLPGVQAAGLVRAAPGQGYIGDGGFAIVEHPPVPVGQIQSAIVRWADPGYFAALGIPLLRGQTFDDNQRLDKANQVIISESFARKFFVDEDPLGRHMRRGPQPVRRIIGVVGDTRFLVSKPAQPMMYFPLYSGEYGSAALVVHSTGDVVGLALPIQQIVQGLDPEIPVFDILTMNQIIGKSTFDASFDSTLVLAFAVLSLMLAAVGLFGVLSYIVAQRTTEIGIRIALGADRGEVLRLALMDGLRPASVGLIFGLAGGAVTAKMIRSLLYDVQPWDASVFACVAIILMCVAIAACLVPALQASRLDPMQALRNE
jgi:predicted permease